jgi:formyl-CoA transferase
VAAPYQAFQTADGYVTVGAISAPTWKGFCAALGLEALEDDPRFAAVDARRAREAELAQFVENVTTTRPTDHWCRLFEAAGVPCGVLYRIDQVFADPHVQARGFVVDLTHAKAGAVRATGSPVRFEKTPVRLETAGPLLGQHTAEVLGALGLSAEEVAQLADSGVIGGSSP